jgi:polyferredoxin
MGLFLFGMVLSLFAGRLYCGWVCPIHPVLRAAVWLKKKLRIPQRKIPGWMRSEVTRFAALGLFALALVFTMVSGKKLPVLPALIGIAAFMSLFFPESLWHRRLCPYGTLLGISARFAGRNLAIDREVCIACGKCQAVCPAEAVRSVPTISRAASQPAPRPAPRPKLAYSIEGRECLLCLECVKVCPKNAISYVPSARAAGLRASPPGSRRA